MNIRWHENLCYACGTCRLICSFHHTGYYWPERSSIKVIRNPQDGSIKWRLEATCNQCVDEREPQCAKYCVYGALKTLPQPPTGKKEAVHD